MKNIFNSILALLCLAGAAFGQAAGNYDTTQKGPNYINNAGIAVSGTYTGIGTASSGTLGILRVDGTVSAAAVSVNGVAISATNTVQAITSPNASWTITNGTASSTVNTSGTTGTLVWTSTSGAIAGKVTLGTLGTQFTRLRFSGTTVLVAGAGAVTDTNVTATTKFFSSVIALGTVTRPVAMLCTGTAATNIAVLSGTATDTSTVGVWSYEP